MADVKIDLQVAHKEFLASLETTAKAIESLIKASAGLEGSQDRLKRSTDDAAKAHNRAAEGTRQHARSASQLESSLKSLGSGITRTIALYAVLYEGAKKAFSIISDTLKASITNIDDFNKAAIGTAAAITNIADMSENAGRTYNDIFLQNLKATKGVFVELERLAARYFASSTDLQLAYNTFAQRGVVIRRTELEQLAQLTDLILLLTGGQLSTIQIQEEIRSLMNGTLRTTAQLSQLLKAFGADVDTVGRKIRATNSLEPLSGILVGAKAATVEIQKTFQATTNGLEVILRQVGRLAGEGFFNTLTKSIQRFTDFLDRNKATITSFFAVIGEALGSIIVRAERFAEAFLSGKNVNASLSGFINLVSVLQVVLSVLVRIGEVVAIMVSNLPKAVQAFSDSLEFANLDPVTRKLKEGERDIKSTIESLKTIAQDDSRAPQIRQLAEKQIKVLQDTLSTIEKQLDDKPFFSKALDSAKKFFGDLVPGATEAKGVVAGLANAVTALSDGLDKLEPLNISEAFTKNKSALQKSVRDVQVKLAEFNKGQTEISAATSTPTTETTEELSKQSTLVRQLIEATVQLERAERNRNQQAAAATIELQLQQLRREFALIEQGFVLTDGAITDVRTSADELTKFLSRNAVSIAQGTVTSVNDLANAIQNVTVNKSRSLLQNLEEQLRITTEGFAKFREQASKDQVDLLLAEAEPHFAAARKLTAEAQAEFNDVIKILQSSVDKARAKLQSATSEKAKKEAGLDLRESEQFQRTGTRRAQERLDQQLELAHEKELLGLADTSKIQAQTDLRLNLEKKKLLEDQLRIVQQLTTEQGKAAQALIAGRGIEEQLRKRTAEREPRTDLSAELSRIEEVRTQVATQIATTTASLTAMAEAAASLETVMPGITERTQEYIGQKIVEMTLLQQSTDVVIQAARNLEILRLALEPIGQAARNAASAFLDSVLGAFEGKKTNFVQVFKGISDQLVRDSMKNTFQELGKSVQEGFKKVFASITGPISDDMAKQLGPAFSAGFGLIASFVLGQLMGDNGGSATAGNPTVGIQSTEQVRGLIGGETQIPIGQIGESLQDALVPTNLLLARIARAVEGQLGGLSSSQIEDVIGRAVGDALQIQSV